MFKKFLAFFYTDVHWKLISLGLAFIIWLLAMNLHDPMENRSYPRDLQIRGLEIMERDDLVVVNEDELRDTSINLGVRGLRSALSRAEDAFVYVDLREVNSALALAADGPITQTLPVRANLVSGIEQQYVRSATVEVELDWRVSRAFPLEIDTYGQARDGFEVQSLRAANPNIVVTGSRGLVNTVARVGVEVDLDNISEDAPIDSPVMVFNHDGEDITSQVIMLSVNATTVTVQVLPVRSVELRVAPIGEMASGFTIVEDELRASELFIDLVGTAERLSEIEYILLEINLEGLSESVEMPIAVDAFLPAGISLSRHAPYDVVINVAVEPVQARSFFVSRRDWSVFDYSAIYTQIAPPANVRVVVMGPQSVVSAMAAADLRVELDLRNLPVGIHWVPLTVGNLPPGVVLAETLQSIQVQIYEPAVDAPDPPEMPPEQTPTPAPPTPTPAPPTPTPEPSPTPEPTPPPDENGNGENGNGDGEPPNGTGLGNGDTEPPDEDIENGND